MSLIRCAALVLLLALLGDIGQLANATSMLLLCVFVVVNAALIVLQRRPGERAFDMPVPAHVVHAHVVEDEQGEGADAHPVEVVAAFHGAAPA